MAISLDIEPNLESLCSDHELFELCFLQEMEQFYFNE